MTVTPERSSAHSNPFLWAVYLGMSWTWVIGMFLPVLLVRDYGFWAWVIFAIPNCIGAAAMGWVMRSREQSVSFTQQHAVAGRVFSLVTIALHLFVAVWLCPLLVGNAGWLVPVVLVQLAFTPLLRGKAVLTASVLTLIASLLIAFGLFTNSGLWLPPAKGFVAGDILGLSLVCLLGFVLCPYLDLTFHRARQSTSDGGAKMAFGIGFCVVFASMIVLTLFYAGAMADLLPSKIVGTLIVAQLAIQSALTVTLHARVLHDQAVARDDAADFRAALGAALGLGLLAGMLAYFARSWSIDYAGLSAGEVIYRCFMSFYGLVAPAYLLINWRSHRPRWVVALIVVLLAMPFYWIAFIERYMYFAMIGVAVVVIGAIVAAIIRPRSEADTADFAANHL